MSIGDEPAFPTNRAGHSPEPGMSIRDYVEVEMLKAIVAAEIAREKCSLKFCVGKAAEAADLWLEQRAERVKT